MFPKELIGTHSSTLNKKLRQLQIVMGSVGKSELKRKMLRCSLVARIAQLVERSAVNRKVGGSNPPVSEFLFF